MQVYGHACGSYTVALRWDPSTQTHYGFRVPNPARPQPKPGHWRTSPRAKVKPAPRKHATPMWRCNIGPSPKLNNASLRTRVREAVAAGLIAPEDAPTWAQP